jgi:hypothetical protein
MRKTIVLLYIVVVLIIVLLKLKNYDTRIAFKQDKLEVPIENKHEPQLTTEPEHRRIYLTILDYNNDTIATNEIYFPENNKFWNKFKDDSTYTISYSEFIKHSYNDNIGAYDMAYMRIYSRIRQRGDLGILKKKYRHNKNYKYNYVNDINWTKVSINQISPNILGWDICIEEFSEFVEEANKKNWSYAKAAYIWQTSDSNANIQYNTILKNLADSVFKKSVNKDFYFLSFSDERTEEGECFGIHDIGIVSDINNDGFADRLATWHDYNTGGVCGITKKSKNGLIEFFKIESGQN